MPDIKPNRNHGIPTGGVFLIFLGVVLLLQPLGALLWNIWNTLWHFWPVSLINTGLGILFRRFNVWAVSLLRLAIHFGSLALAIQQAGNPLPVDIDRQLSRYSPPRDFFIPRP